MTQNTHHFSDAAGRYALSLFEISREENALEDIEKNIKFLDEALIKSEAILEHKAVVEPEPSVEPEATVETEAFKEQIDVVKTSELEKPKIYDNLNDYTTLDNDAKVLKDKVEQEDIDHLETLSNKTAIRELKESIEESHKSEEKVVDDFSFFEDAVRFQ